LLLIAGFDWFAKGGWAMYPLVLLSVYTLFVILNRAHFFATRIRRTDSELDSVLRGTSLLPDRLEGVLAPLLARGIKDGEFEPGRANLAVEHELLEATRYLNSLDTVAIVAPMLGLLGTVSGMVATFQTVAELQGAVNPSVLAGGIWEALLTTAFGLIVAIPAIIGFRYFRSRLIRWENHLHTVVDDAGLLAGEGPRAGVKS
jgi:biopolymer transport protein ExbB